MLHKRLAHVYHSKHFKASSVAVLLFLTIVLQAERITLTILVVRVLDFVAEIIEYGWGFEEKEANKLEHDYDSAKR